MVIPDPRQLKRSGIQFDSNDLRYNASTRSSLLSFSNSMPASPS
jgi:hypothetical protein